jgi:uncharacterized protein YgiM (DUF1202 family)
MYATDTSIVRLGEDVSEEGEKNELQITDTTDEEEEIVEELSFENEGYVNTSSLLVREEATKESDVVGVLNLTEEVQYAVVPSSDEYVAIETEDGGVAYISSDYIADTKEEITGDSTSYDVSGDKRKSYMSYKKITDKSSRQYALQQRATTDAETGIRTVAGRYCVAIGSAYNASIGDLIDVTLTDGTVIECVVGDAKKNCDTNTSNTIGNDGSAVEFIVCVSQISSATRKAGDISEVENLSAKVSNIKVYDTNMLKN